MRDDQLKAIVGLLSGVEMSVVLLASILEEKGVASRKDIAASYRAAAANIEPEVANRALIVTVLGHIASGLEGSDPPDPDHRLRLIKGGK